MPEMTAETAVLHAVLDEDLDDARQRLADFLPGELRDLDDAIDTLSDLIAERRRELRAAGRAR